MARTPLSIPAVYSASGGLVTGTLYTVPVGKVVGIKVGLTATPTSAARYKKNGTIAAQISGGVDQPTATFKRTVVLQAGDTFQLEVQSSAGVATADASGWLYDA